MKTHTTPISIHLLTSRRRLFKGTWRWSLPLCICVNMATYTKTCYVDCSLCFGYGIMPIPSKDLGIKMV
jgi:hypothetical protein